MLKGLRWPFGYLKHGITKNAFTALQIFAAITIILWNKAIYLRKNAIYTHIPLQFWYISVQFVECYSGTIDHRSWWIAKTRVSRKYSLLIDVDKTKVMASNGIACRILIHTHSEWATGAGGYVPIPWIPDYRIWWVYDGIPYQVQGAGDLGIITENMEKSQHTNFNEGSTD